MMRKMDFKQYNFRLINFNHLFYKNIEIKLIDDLHNYGFLQSKIRTDAKKFIYHHIIHGICEFLLNDKTTEKSVIYFNNTQLDNFKLLKYFKEEDVLKIINSVLLKVKKLLPIKVFITNISFDFLSHLLEKNDGRGIEIINSIRNYLNSVNIEKFTFNKVKTFTKKNDLVFLNKEYFNLLKTKQLLIV